MRHVTVYGEAGIYAGWPANHGAWQWGDEFLVGFMTGKHELRPMHNISMPFTKLLARSVDGGENWSTEVPNKNFEADETQTISPLIDPQDIIRVCGRYDHGGEYCGQRGGFYKSSDRGKSWSGAFELGGLETQFGGKNHNTSRTCVLGDLIFFSAAVKAYWGTDYVFCATHDGRQFQEHGVVLNGPGRAVMPRAAAVGDRIVVVMRRLGQQYFGGWIDSVYSDDGGKTWSEPRLAGLTGAHNGNPPALIELNGVLYCAFANRSEECIWISESKDGGETWALWNSIRDHGDSDIGYPQLFKRSDGNLVCVYYWADTYEDCQRIEATIFDPQ